MTGGFRFNEDDGSGVSLYHNPDIPAVRREYPEGLQDRISAGIRRAEQEMDTLDDLERVHADIRAGRYGEGPWSQ